MMEAIAFDFDGVVVDAEPMHFRAFLQVGEPLGFTMDWQRYLRDLIGYDDRDAFRTILRELGQLVEDERVAELCVQKQKAMDRMIAEGVPMIPGARELIEAAHAESLPIAIASGATRRDITLILEGLDLLDRFPQITSADDVEHSKPHPRTYQLAAERLGIDPAHCLAIEDTPFGIQSARGAGMMTLGLATTGPAKNLHEAQRVIDDLTGVTPTKLREWYAD